MRDRTPHGVYWQNEHRRASAGPNGGLRPHRCSCPKIEAYCHARLSSTEFSGPSGEPVEVKYTRKLDISGLSDAELDVLESALEKVISKWNK